MDPRFRSNCSAADGLALEPIRAGAGFGGSIEGVSDRERSDCAERSGPSYLPLSEFSAVSTLRSGSATTDSMIMARNFGCWPTR